MSVQERGQNVVGDAHSEPTRVDVSSEAAINELDIEKGSLHENTTETLEKDPNIIDFSRPHDLENPMDWPKSKKNVAIIIVTCMTLFSYVSF